MNLAELPIYDRQAIERDKRRWLEARKMLDTRRPSEIRAWLSKIRDDDDREDWRRRLNAINARRAR